MLNPFNTIVASLATLLLLTAAANADCALALGESTVEISNQAYHLVDPENVHAGDRLTGPVFNGDGKTYIYGVRTFLTGHCPVAVSISENRQDEGTARGLEDLLDLPEAGLS